jgi:copper chaperone CopZ
MRTLLTILVMSLSFASTTVLATPASETAQEATKKSTTKADQQDVTASKVVQEDGKSPTKTSEASVTDSKIAKDDAKSSLKTVKVNGMVCAFCAQGIEKNLKSDSAVDKVDVSLENHQVVVHFKPGKTLGDDRITELLKSAGYSVVGIK